MDTKDLIYALKVRAEANKDSAKRGTGNSCVWWSKGVAEGLEIAIREIEKHNKRHG